MIFGCRSAWLGSVAWLVFLITPLPALAHVGHDAEFQGGDPSRILQPLQVDANTATSLGIRADPIPESSDGRTVSVPSSSIVEVNGQKLVYLKEGETYYRPVVIATSGEGGDRVTIQEGNVRPGQLVVTQGSPLLYAQALRGKSQAQITILPEQKSLPWGWMIVSGVSFSGLLVVGAIADRKAAQRSQLGSGRRFPRP